MAEDRNDAVMKTLHFDGEDETKWDTWRFKMLAYAGKKGHKEAFLTDYKFGEDKEKWSDKEKANKPLTPWMSLLSSINTLKEKT